MLRGSVFMGVCAASVGVLLALAGCGTSPPSPSPAAAVREAEQAADDLPLQATASTGVLRGFVLDAAYHPLAHANATLSTGQATATNAQGAFGFEGLETGTYFLAVAKPGFKVARFPVDVRAGVDAPDAVKVILEASGAGAFVETYHDRGYMDSSISVGLLGTSQWLFTSRLTSLVTGDNGTIDGQWDVTGQDLRWMQHDLAWDASTRLGERMELDCYRYDRDERQVGNGARAVGADPLSLAWNTTDLVALQGEGKVWCLYASAAPSDPAGIGATVDQHFDVFTNVFHGFVPKEGWSFVLDGAPTPPS